MSPPKTLNSRKEGQLDQQPLGNPNISIIQNHPNFGQIMPPNPDDSSMISERQTYETFFGKLEPKPREKGRFFQAKLESNQKLKSIEKDYSKISSYYDEMSNIVMSQNQEILETNHILGEAAGDMLKANSEVKDSLAIRATATGNTIRTLLMLCLVLFVLGFIYLV